MFMHDDPQRRQTTWFLSSSFFSSSSSFFSFESKVWAEFVETFMTFYWCVWKAHRFFWDSLGLIYGKVLDKQVTCTHTAEAKRKTFPVHLSHDIQSCSVMPWIPNIKVGSQRYWHQFCLRTIRVVHHVHKVTVKLKYGLMLWKLDESTNTLGHATLPSNMTSMYSPRLFLSAESNWRKGNVMKMLPVCVDLNRLTWQSNVDQSLGRL